MTLPLTAQTFFPVKSKLEQARKSRSMVIMIKQGSVLEILQLKPMNNLVCLSKNYSTGFNGACYGITENTTTYIQVTMSVRYSYNLQNLELLAPCQRCCLIPDPDIISPLNQINAFNFPILILFYSYMRGMS